MSVENLHVVGDVFDRGGGAERIIDKLMNFHQVSFQWGNHDVLWMGASRGSLVGIASVLRLSLKYGNTRTLEAGYGIHLMPLVKFGLRVYEKGTGFKSNKEK